MACSHDHGAPAPCYNTYWVTFTDRPPASVWIQGEDAAREVAEQHGAVEKIEILPYPANPRLDDQAEEMPSFCWRPSECAGKTSCPRDFSCVD